MGKTNRLTYRNFNARPEDRGGLFKGIRVTVSKELVIVSTKKWRQGPWLPDRLYNYLRKMNKLK